MSPSSDPPLNPSEAAPAATVIVAAPHLRDSKEAFPGREALIEQAREVGAEALVVWINREHGIALRRLWPESASDEPASPRPPGRLVPHLWQAGIAAARGGIVVLTLAGLTPRAGWLAAHLRAHASGAWGAVGGAIEPDPASRRMDRAIALCRYSGFILPFEPREVADVAADNASYSRAAVEACADLTGDGFWEPPVHARMRELGMKLLLDPAAVMLHERTSGFAEFVSQRLRHGFRFGRDRRRGGVTAGWMIKYLVFCPALPLMLTARVFGRLRAKGRSPGLGLGVLPELVCFNIAWSVGEIAGTLWPRG